jgi:hypothetical protein
MTSDEERAHRLLVAQWTSTKDLLNQLGLVETRPEDVYRLFSICGTQKFPEAMSFEIGPLTLYVPERANSVPSIYVVVRGLIHLDRAALAERRLMTHSFATEAAYFRENNSILSHVYGTHYDFSYDDVGHPIFHAQIKSYHERAQVAVDAYSLSVEIDPEDAMSNVLRTVRVPTAQMDFFALVLQIVADHLIDKSSRPDELATFAELRTLGSKLSGAGYRWHQLAEAPTCMRAHHWYR